MNMNMVDFDDAGWTWEDLARELAERYGKNDIEELVEGLHRRCPEAFLRLKTRRAP